MSQVLDVLRTRYPLGTLMHAYLAPQVDAFVQSGCADANYMTEFTSGDEGQFWSRVWEAILYGRFQRLGWGISSAGTGPDFVIDTGSGVVLVEAGVPSPEGLPPGWIAKDNTCTHVPHEVMLLRWTSLLSDKRKKHDKDIALGRVSAETPFIVALNSCRLGPDEHGISLWPFAVEAVFPVGPLAVNINTETMKWGDAYQTARFSVRKDDRIDIPTNNFLDAAYANVSALLGSSACFADEVTLAKFNGAPPMVLVHNPLAKNPLPPGWLPGAIEFAATETAKDEYTLAQVTA